ncbi:MAG: PEP-CTERM sorting domain-containing protein [Planctomycetota bacterium]|nr:MAG: PEP-CTERM sorting domain-containing protein [Planctomycetota bacterium]
MVGLTTNKRPVAYVVLIAVALASSARDATAVVVNSNSIVQDNIEYVMQTDKSVYNLGENVQMLYGVINRGNDSVTFHFDYVVQYYFTAESNGKLIWDEPKANFPALTSFTLLPGYFKQYTETWNMRNNQGEFITVGSYEITGSLGPFSLDIEDQNRYVPVSVQIQVVPEPATICLFGLGSLILLRKRRA